LEMALQRVRWLSDYASCPNFNKAQGNPASALFF